MKKTLALLLASLLLVSMLFAVSCDKAQFKREITGTGTEDDPWVCGLGIDDDVYVSVTGNRMKVYGDGEMLDFASPEDRPWDGIIRDIEDLSIEDDIRSIGKYAFYEAGINAECTSVYIGNDVRYFGDHSFENVNYDEWDTISLPDKTKTIGERAFAGLKVNHIYMLHSPRKIADDAFADVTADFDVYGWTEEQKLGYGGELTYNELCRIRYTEEYDTEDWTGSGESYVPVGEEYYESGESYDERFAFDRWEVVSGDLEIEDPTDPELTFTVKSDVKFIKHYVRIAGDDYYYSELDYEEYEDGFEDDQSAEEISEDEMTEE